MLRMNVSASITEREHVPALLDPLGAQHVALEAHVVRLVGVKAVKSCVPHERGGAAPSASRSSGRGHQSARPRSNGLGAPRVARGSGRCG
jgi:hypothetical protein